MLVPLQIPPVLRGMVIVRQTQPPAASSACQVVMEAPAMRMARYVSLSFPKGEQLLVELPLVHQTKPFVSRLALKIANVRPVLTVVSKGFVLLHRLIAARF